MCIIQYFGWYEHVISFSWFKHETQIKIRIVRSIVVQVIDTTLSLKFILKKHISNTEVQ